MKLITSLITGLITITALVGAQAQSNRVSPNSAEPVITLDYQGDRLIRINDAPTLSIYADGTVVMPQSYAHTAAYEDFISQTELQGLLNFIITENRFFEYDSAAVRVKEIGLRRQPLPLHMADTVIRVNAGNGAKEVRYRALGRGAMAPETQRLLAVKNRLDQVMSVAKLGGREQATYWLETANREASLKYGDAKPFTLFDLKSGGYRADGSVYVRFAHDGGAVNSSVTIDLDAAGKSNVLVVRDEQ